MAERQTPSPRRPGEGGERRQQGTYRPESQRRPASYRDGGEQRRQTAYRDSSDQRRQTAYRGGSDRRQTAYRDSGERRQAPGRRNDVIRCENCGEDYAITYKRCPFCDERPGRGGFSGKRVANTRGGGYGRPASALKIASWAASFLVILCAGIIIFRFMGSPIFGRNRDPNSTSSSQNGGGSNPGSAAGQPGGDDSSADTSTSPQTPDSSVQSIKLSSSDVTLDAGGVHQLTAALLPAGAEGTVTWSSSDESVATVDENGRVTNVNTGSSTTRITITAVCGDVNAECVFYCKGGSSGGTAVSGRQGTIVNAEKGLNVRSGPGTTYDKVASITNGSKITIQSEENGWYKIDYGGGKIGYVLKDYVSVG